MKLGGYTGLPQDEKYAGYFSEGQGHRGQMSNFCISEVFGSISMKLGGYIQNLISLLFTLPLQWDGTKPIYFPHAFLLCTLS